MKFRVIFQYCPLYLIPFLLVFPLSLLVFIYSQLPFSSPHPFLFAVKLMGQTDWKSHRYRNQYQSFLRSGFSSRLLFDFLKTKLQNCNRYHLRSLFFSQQLVLSFFWQALLFLVVLLLLVLCWRSRRYLPLVLLLLLVFSLGKVFVQVRFLSFILLLTRQVFSLLFTRVFIVGMGQGLEQWPHSSILFLGFTLLSISNQICT